MIPFEPKSSPFHINEEELEPFLAEIAHKMKNKLGGIQGFAFLLEKDLPAGDSKRRFTQKIQDGILQLDSILVDFMKLFQKGKPQPKSLDILSLLKNAWFCFWEEHASKGRPEVPTVESTGGEISVTVDPELAEELFLHMFTYAWGVAERIEKVHLETPTSDQVRIHLMYSLAQDIPPQSLTTNIHDLILYSDPIDARLSLAVAGRCGDLMNGSMTIQALSPSRRRLTFQFNRGT